MKWDVKKEDKILYFDPTLSYELTGYRPITETQGLDFKPEWFTVDAQTKDETGHYTKFKIKTKPYNEFWAERYRRCTEGYTVNGYRLTGDNYFYLNFYRMINAKKGIESFPTFINVQYEWFHYVELCEKLGFDCCALKPRGVNSSPR